MSSLRKNAIKIIDYESNPINPLGLSCILLKCHDLYTLALSSISVFYEVFTNTENLLKLNINFQKLAKRILDIPSCSWLLLMLYAAPHPLTTKVLEELVIIFSTARKLPKGLSIRGARGKAHLNPDDYNSILVACREAIKLTMILFSKVNKTPLESRSPIWLLGLKLLGDEDVSQSVLAANTLLYELENNSKRLIIANEIQIIITCLKTRVKKFEQSYKEVTRYTKLVKSEKREFIDKKRQFNEILFEITHMEHEHELDVPLEYYLKDHDDLRRAHEIRVKAKQTLENTNQTLKQWKGIFDISFACVRLICLLLSRAIVLYTGLHLDTTSLLNLDTISTVPLTSVISSDLNPLVYGGYSSENNPKNKIQKESLITSLIQDIPWNELSSILWIERIVSGTCSIRLLAATVCKFSDTLQLKLISWCRRALEDLLHQPRWYSVTENIPEYDAPPPASKRELFRSLSVEEPPLPKAIYFNRLMSLDSRISCALVYWNTRGNTVILKDCSKWIDTTTYQQDLESISSKKKKSLEVSNKYLIWIQLIKQTEQKSQIIFNEEEYYAIHDPSRKFREMELKSLATTELVITDDGDDDDDDDFSESDESNGDDENNSNEGSDIYEENSMYTSQNNNSEKFKINLIPKHKKVYHQMINDRYAMSLLHLTASEYVDDTVIVNDFNLYEDSQKISQSLSVCSKYIHDELYPHMMKLLSFALEGPSDQELYRYSHPFQIITSLLEHDTMIGLSETICQDIPLSCIKYIVKQSISIQEGIVDNIFRNNALSLLSCLFGGLHMHYFYPSLGPIHQHTISQTQLIRQKYKIESQESTKMTSIKLYFQCKTQIELLVTNLCETIYKSRREDFLPSGDNGRSYISRIGRFLTIIADLDDLFIWTSLTSAMENRSLEVEKIKFWPSNCPISTEYLWLAPFILLLQGGTSKLVLLYRRTQEWKVPDLDEESYGNSVYRGYYDVCRHFIGLLSVLCSANQSISLAIAENATYIVPAILSSLKAKDRILNQQIYRIATAVVSSAAIPINPSNPSSSKSIPFDAPATYFRLLLFQEGDGLDIASEMIREVYYDLWGIEKKNNNTSTSSNLQLSNSKNLSIIPSSPTKTSKVVNNITTTTNNNNNNNLTNERKQSLPPITSSSLTNKDTNKFKLTRVGSDSRFPQLGVKSGSLRNLHQPQSNSEINHRKSSDQEISANDTYLHQLMNILPEKTSKETNQEYDSEGEDDFDNNHNNNQSKKNRHTKENYNNNGDFDNNNDDNDNDNDNYDDENDEGFGKNDSNDQEELKEPEESSDDEDEQDLDSTFDIVTEWKDRLEYEKIRTARDFLLYTLECFVEVCENRMELQDRIAEKSSYLFESLHGILTPIIPRSEKKDIILHEDDSVSIGEYPTHLGVTGSCSQVLRTLVKRHNKIRAIIRQTACIEGLIDALDVSYVVDDKVLGLYIVIAIEQLIVRNLDIWNYVKNASGIKGLLQLCHMGNTAIRILACTDIIQQITSTLPSSILSSTANKLLSSSSISSTSPATLLINDILKYHGLSTIVRMLHSSNTIVQSNTLILLKLLCSQKLLCRQTVLTNYFIIELCTLLFSTDLNVIRVACEILLVLGTEDQYTLRLLVENMNSHINYVSYIHGKDVYYISNQMTINPTVDRLEDKNGVTIKSRLIDISNGILSTTSISEKAFYIDEKKKKLTSKYEEIDEVKQLLLFDPDPSNEMNTSYKTEYVSKSGKFYEEPRYLQDIVAVAHLAANVLASMTDGEEANWPDGGAPLRQTMKVSGILPNVQDDNFSQRRNSEINLLQYKY